MEDATVEDATAVGADMAGAAGEEADDAGWEWGEDTGTGTDRGETIGRPSGTPDSMEPAKTAAQALAMELGDASTQA